MTPNFGVPFVPKVASADMGVFQIERGRRKGAKKTRNLEAFQKMYMDPGQNGADARILQKVVPFCSPSNLLLRFHQLQKPPPIFSIF